MGQSLAQNIVERAAKQVSARMYALLMKNEAKYIEIIDVNSAVTKIADAMILDLVNSSSQSANWLQSETTLDSKTNVHTAHCCIRHGCKYGEEDCPVATGKHKQTYPCEICD